MNQDSLDLNDFEGVTTLIVSTTKCTSDFIERLQIDLDMQIVSENALTGIIILKKIRN